MQNAEHRTQNARNRDSKAHVSCRLRSASCVLGDGSISTAGDHTDEDQIRKVPYAGCNAGHADSVRHWAFPTFSATLVEVATDDGLVGIGECIVRRAPQATQAIVDHMLRPVLIGRDPHDVEGLWDEMFQQLRGWGHYRGFVFEALSGVDTALWDILGKAAGLPVYKVLAGAGRPRVPCYASSVYFAEVKEMATQAADQARRGHTAIKVKIGRSPQLGGRRMDVSSAKATREAVGPRVDIM